MGIQELLDNLDNVYDLTNANDQDIRNKINDLQTWLEEKNV